MKIIIDRIEGELAVAQLPDMTFINLPLKLLPGAKDGDCYTIEKDLAETTERWSNMQDRFNRLKKSNDNNNR